MSAHKYFWIETRMGGGVMQLCRFTSEHTASVPVWFDNREFPGTFKGTVASTASITLIVSKTDTPFGLATVRSGDVQGTVRGILVLTGGHSAVHCMLP